MHGSLANYLMILDMLWEASVTINITEVELASICEHSICLLQDSLLIRAQVDHTVADDKVKRLISYPSFIKVLYMSLNKTHICLLVAELLAIRISMPL